MARTLLHDGNKDDDQNREHDRNHAFSSHGNLMWLRVTKLQRVLGVERSR